MCMHVLPSRFCLSPTVLPFAVKKVYGLSPSTIMWNPPFNVPNGAHTHHTSGNWSRAITTLIGTFHLMTTMQPDTYNYDLSHNYFHGTVAFGMVHPYPLSACAHHKLASNLHVCQHIFQLSVLLVVSHKCMLVSPTNHCVPNPQPWFSSVLFWGVLHQSLCVSDTNVFHFSAFLGLASPILVFPRHPQLFQFRAFFWNWPH